MLYSNPSIARSTQGTGRVALLALIALCIGLVLYFQWSGRVAADRLIEPQIGAHTTAGGGMSDPLVDVVVPDTLRTGGTATESRSATLERGLRVLVVDTNDAPVSGAKILLFDRGTAFDREPRGPLRILTGSAPSRPSMQASTDPDGVASFPKQVDTQCYLVCAPLEHLPQVAFMDAGTASARIVVSKGATLEGELTVDGRRPGQPMSLRVEGFTGPRMPVGLDRSAVEAALGHALHHTEVRVTPDGDFESRPLPLGELLVVNAPREFRTRTGEPLRWSVESGTHGLRFDVETGRQFLLELESQPGELPISGNVSVSLELLRRNGPARTKTFTLAPGKSRSVPLASGVFALRAVARKGRVVLSRDSWHEPLPEHGVLRAPGLARTLRFRVMTGGGDPIVDAHAATAGMRFGPSDVDGRIELNVFDATREVVLGASGYEATRVSIAGADRLDYDVRLQRATKVTVVVEPGSAALDGWGVHIRHPKELAAGERIQGGPPPSDLDADGRWSTTDLPSGSPFELRVSDRYGYDIWKQRLTLEPGEAREIKVDAPRGSMSLLGTVLDPTGTPIVGARVFLMNSFFPAAVTAEAGFFELHNVQDPAPKLRIDAPGYARFYGEGEDLFGMHEFHLTECRSLWVEVLDQNGPCDVEQLELLRMPGIPSIHAVRVGRGVYRLDRVPFGECTLRAQDPWFETKVEAHSSRVRVEI